jgi:hypothetical protein
VEKGMHFKFIHRDGYEVSIKDAESFLQHLKSGAITKNSIVFDEENGGTKKASEIEEFREIFDIMEEKWCVYDAALVDADGLTDNSSNLLQKDKNLENALGGSKNKNTNSNGIRPIFKDLNKEYMKNSETVVKKKLGDRIKDSMSKGVNRVLIIMSSIVIAISIAIIAMSNPKSEAFLFIIDSGTISRIGVSILIAFIISMIIWKLFFGGEFIIALLFFSVILFAIAAFYFGNTIDAIKNPKIPKMQPKPVGNEEIGMLWNYYVYQSIACVKLFIYNILG